MTTLTRAELGALGEQLALDHLQSRGLVLLARNWRCRYGELDLIAADIPARTVVFVEVKTRTTDQFGGRSMPRRCAGCAGWLHCGWRSRIAVGPRFAST